MDNSSSSPWTHSRVYSILVYSRVTTISPAYLTAEALESHEKIDERACLCTTRGTLTSERHASMLHLPRVRLNPPILTQHCEYFQVRDSQISSCVAGELVKAIGQHVASTHNIEIRTVLVLPRSLPKTTSGKVKHSRRRRQEWRWEATFETKAHLKRISRSASIWTVSLPGSMCIWAKVAGVASHLHTFGDRTVLQASRYCNTYSTRSDVRTQCLHMAYHDLISYMKPLWVRWRV